MRSVFLIDPAGVVRWSWVRTDQQPLPDYDEVVVAAERVAAESPDPTL